MIMDKYFTPEYVVRLLINKDDLISLAKKATESNSDNINYYLDAIDDLNKILMAYRKLPDKFKQRIHVYLYSGLTQTEIAEKMGTKQPNIKRDFLRAIDKLIKLIPLQ